jgi:hypothetical protein
MVDGYQGAVSDFTIQVSCGAPQCAPDLELFCGASDTFNNGGKNSTDWIDQYPQCIDWDESGPEYTYTFTPTANADITVDITSASDLDIFILEEQGNGCDPATCLAYGDTSVQFSAVAGTTYYIVVDGRNGAQDDYTLNIDCSATQCQPDWDLACGGTDTYNNGDLGSTNSVNSYPACIGWDESGPEYTYTFAPAQDASVTVDLTPVSGDLDIFILEEQGTGCDPATCLAYGDITTQFNAVAGTTYYIVVDGKAGAVDDYDIAVTCN